MFVDLETFLVVQSAAADRQVVQLALIAGIGRQAHVEAPDVARIVPGHRRLARAPGHPVLAAVGQ
ncbi:hypothetical protein D3C76_1776020 [compost metagenome]